ncbi:MAG: RHS repeat-associated core domain-containing protein [Lysobacterales bacterium]|jgi:RHS repeat-associated protein
MLQSALRCAVTALIVITSVWPSPASPQTGPETKRCLTREQLLTEPLFSACPPLVDEASVSDESFISKLYLYRGYDSYALRWQGPSYFQQNDYTWNPETGAYEGICGSQFCELYPPSWVQQEHWPFLVGTLLAEDVGSWTYSELRNGEVFQSRNFEVRELELSALSGGQQMGLVGENLPQPLVLQLESFEGVGIEDEVIGWDISGPGGAKGAAVYGIGSGSETNTDGIDTATVRLGSKPGVYTVTLNNRRITQESWPSFSFTAIDDIDDTDPVDEHPETEEGVGGNHGQQCDRVGNPITLSVGNKFQREVDLEAAGLSPIEFIRYHNSLGFLSRSFNNYWTHSYDRYLELPADPQQEPVKVVRPDGRKVNFFWTGSGFEPHPGVYSSLEQTADGWRYTDEELTVETFDADGLLLEITGLSGMRQIAVHDSGGRLVRIESSLGDGLDFDYDRSDRLASVTDSAGRRWAYRYDTLGRLAFVDRPDGTTREYHYEDLRHAYALTGITLEDGNRYATYAYDELGRAIGSWHAGDIDRVDVQYEDDGSRVVVDPLGNATVYETSIENKRGFLDAISGPVCSQGCGETETQYDYDADGNIIRKTTDGIITEYGAFDDKGQPGFIVRAAGTPEEKRIDYKYDPGLRNRITQMTEPSVYPGASKITHRTYDVAGNLVEESITGFDPSGGPVSRTTSWTFEGPYGQVSSMDGPRTDVADVTTYEYYPDTMAEGPNRARLRAIVDPNGIRIRDGINYSPTGRILSERRPNGVMLQYDYEPGSDRIASLTTTGGPLFNRTQWTYYPTGEVERIAVEDEAGEQTVTRFYYDEARRLTRVEAGLGGDSRQGPDLRVSYTLDPVGNVIGEEHWSKDGALNQVLIQRLFDAYGHLDQITQGGVTEDFDYSPDGTLAARTDGNLNTTRYDYDAFKRLISTEQFGQVTTLREYGTHGNATALTDPEGHTTRYRYDDLGNRLQLDSPDTGLSGYEYDEAGRVMGQVDAMGQHSHLAYDPGGRLTSVDREGLADDVQYRYDDCPNGEGRLCGASVGWGHATAYAWNGLGEIATVTTAAGQLGYTHGPQGSLTSIRYPSGREVHFNRDAADLIRQIRLLTPGQGESILLDEIRYSPMGRPIAWRFANGLETHIQLDARSRVQDIDVQGALSWQAAGYDGNGNLLGLLRDGSTATFGYDRLNRLVTADLTGLSLGFTYDDNGNRLSLNTNGIAEDASYVTGTNRLAAFGDRQYGHDLNGNTTSILRGTSPSLDLLYTRHNRLSEMVDTGSSQDLATYRYDALGQRVEKTSGGETQKFLYGLNGELLAVLNGSSVVRHEYVYLGGQVVADLGPGSETPPGPPAEEVIIDTDQAEVFGANWRSKRSDLAVGGSYLQNRKLDGRGIYWYLDETGSSGAYDIYVRWLNPEGDGYATRYGVDVLNTAQTAYQSTDVVVSHDEVQQGDWVLLGNFEIQPRNENWRQRVTLTGFDNWTGSAGTFLEADAIRLVPTFIQEESSTVHFIHGDHLGTPQAVTDLSGQVVWRASYLPFGQATIEDDVDGDGVPYELNLRFPGQYYDEESGLDYNYFRTYDPETGRYLESDPIGLAGGLNTYAYVAANPVTGADPLGLFQMCHRDLLLPIPYARHCYARFEDGTTSSFTDKGVGPDGDPDNPDTVCTHSRDTEKNQCIERAMQQCAATNYDFIRFNCCHCVEQALKECGASIPVTDWPNWPINPGPQPGEPGYTPYPVYDPTLGG